MTDMLQEEEERLKHLYNQLEKLQQKVKRKEARINEQKRKERTRRLIEVGGLVEIADLTTVDKAILLGALLEIKEAMHDPDRLQNWKEKGGTTLQERARKRQGSRDQRNEGS